MMNCIQHTYCICLLTTDHNETMLCKLPTPLISINDVHEFPRDCSKADINEAMKRSQSETGGLALLLRLQIGA